MQNVRKEPPPLPGSENRDEYHLNIPDLVQFSLERAERRLIEASRIQEAEVLSAARDPETVEAGGTNFVLFLIHPKDALESLDQIEKSLHENGLQEGEWSQLDDLLHRIETQFPEDEKIGEEIERIRSFIGHNDVNEILRVAKEQVDTMPPPEARSISDIPEDEEPFMLVPKPEKKTLKPEPITAPEPPKPIAPSVHPFKREKKEIKEKKRPELHLFGNDFYLPVEDLDEAKKLLEKIKKMAEQKDFTREEEAQLLTFLQEAEQAYPNTTELNGLIAEIEKATKKQVEEESDYNAVTAVPNVPVEFRRPFPTTATAEESTPEPAPAPAPAPEPTPAPPPAAEPPATTPAEPATTPTSSPERPKNKAELQLAGETYKIQARDIKKAIKALKKIRGKLQHSETTPEEKAEVNKFLDEVSNLYRDTTDPDDLIAEIRDILVKPKAVEEVVEEAVEEVAEEIKTEKPKTEAPSDTIVDEPPTGPAPADSETPKEKTAPPEDIDKVVEYLLSTLQGLPEVRDLSILIRLLKTRPANVPASRVVGYKRQMKYNFGTDDVRTIRESINNGDNEFLKRFIAQPMLDDGGNTDQRIVLKRLIEGLEGEKTYAVALDAVNDMLGKLKDLKIKDTKSSSAPDSSAKSETAPEPKTEPPMGPAPAEPKAEAKADEAKKPDRTPDTPAEPKSTETAPERSRIPDSLAVAIDKASEGDEQKKNKLLDLWEVVKGKAKLDDKKLAEDVKKIMERSHNFSRKGITMDLAVGGLKRLLIIAEYATVRPLDADESNLNRLQQHIDLLALGNKELQERLSSIFKILQVDPKSHPEKAAIIERIQKSVRRLLLVNLSTDLELGKSKDLAELLGKLEDQGDLLEQQRLMAKFSKTILEDKELVKVIEYFNKMMSEDDEPDEPPSTPSAPSATGSGAPAASSSNDTLLDDDDDKLLADTSTSPSDSANPNPEEEKDREGDHENKEENEEDVSDFPSETERMKAIDTFITSRGYKLDSAEPAVVAMRKVLESRIKMTASLAGLERFLKAGVYEDEIDVKYKADKLEDLKTKWIDKSKQLRILETKISDARTALGRRSVTQEETDQLRKDLIEYAGEKHEYNAEILELDKAIERKKQRKDKETIHYRNPLQLLGMINMYFAKEEAGEGNTPDYAKALQATHDQLEEAREVKTSKMNWVCNRLLPWNYLKPRLAATLQAVVEKDPVLKKIKPEYVAGLAKAWDNPRSVDAWIQGLEGSEKDNMEKVIPALIAHLSVATNTGRVANINSISLNRAQNLLKILRHSVHEYSMKHAEAHSGNSLDKMGAYFTEMNTIGKNSISHEDIVTSNSRKRMWANIGKASLVGGAGIGALAMTTLSAPLLFGASMAGMAVPLAYASRKIEDPKKKEILNSVSKRVIATGALGGLTMASLPSIMSSVAAGATAIGTTGGLVLTAAPLLIPAVLAGMFAPEIKKIGVGRFGLGALSIPGAVLMPFTGYSKWKKIFGLHKGDLTW